MKPSKPCAAETRSSSAWRYLLIAIIASGILLACSKAWQDLRLHLNESGQNLRWEYIGYTFLIALSYRLINSLGWIFTVQALRIPLSIGQGMGIWLTSEAMRWLPGSVWSWGSRAWQAHQKLGISLTRASLSVTLELILTLTAWALSATIAFAFSEMRQDVLTMLNFRAFFVLLVVATFAVLGLGLFLKSNPQGKIQKKVYGIWQDLKNLLRERPRFPLFAFTLFFYTCLCAINGLGLYVLIHAFLEHPPTLPTLITINSLAWIAGFLAIGAPGGVGVREAGITGMLSFAMPASAAFLTAISWRLVQVLAEVSCLIPLLPKILTRRK